MDLKTKKRARQWRALLIYERMAHLELDVVAHVLHVAAVINLPVIAGCITVDVTTCGNGERRIVTRRAVCRRCTTRILTINLA